MPAAVYLETTIVSYLTARPSRDLIMAAHQQISREWWERRTAFALHVSQLVVEECSAGDDAAACQRLAMLADVPVLRYSDEVGALARALVAEGPLPLTAAADALHIAFAVVHGMDYLLTWNCAHIANASIRGAIAELCLSRGYEVPVICTPEELLEEIDGH